MNSKQIEGYLKGLDFALSIMKLSCSNEDKIDILEKVIRDLSKEETTLD